METVKNIRYVLFGIAISFVIALVVGLLFFPAKEGQANGAPTWTATPVLAQPAATGTPVPLAQPTASNNSVSIHQVPVVNDREQLTLNLLARMERTLAERDAEIEMLRAGQPAAAAPVPAGDPAETKPTPELPSMLNVWEDGNCWTSPDMQVMQLCGAAAGDGYVVRWLGVHGDSRGPEIPDSDYLAVRGGHDRLVWAGHHPATGEAVTVTYWSRGHVLAVHAAGRLLFRIDRNHQVTE